MATTIPTFLLDRLILEEKGDYTISELRTEQLAALPYYCPICDGVGLIEIVPASEGNPAQLTADPLCQGMGKTVNEYVLVNDTQHWEPAPPPPPPVEEYVPGDDEEP